MYTAETTYRVLYADIDQMGFVYYGNYAKFFEIGRVESLRKLGVTYKAIEEMGVWMPVYELNSRYIEPAKYDDLITIKTTIKEMPKARIVFHSDVFNEAGKLLHQAKVTLVFLRSEDAKLQLCPSIISNKLLPFFNAAK
jgi:acyl-CoA thioester hydrolase